LIIEVDPIPETAASTFEIFISIICWIELFGLLLLATETYCWTATYYFCYSLIYFLMTFSSFFLRTCDFWVW